MIACGPVHIFDVATVASVATNRDVASVASVATPRPVPRALSHGVATVATREIHVATAKPLIRKASGHSSHTGHMGRTDLGFPLGIESYDGRRGRASILSFTCGYCGQCGHWPDFSITYQWPHEISMWPLWPLGKIDPVEAGSLSSGSASTARVRVRGPPPALTNRPHCRRRRPDPPRTEPSPPRPRSSPYGDHHGFLDSDFIRGRCNPAAHSAGVARRCDPVARPRHHHRLGRSAAWRQHRKRQHLIPAEPL